MLSVPGTLAAVSVTPDMVTAECYGMSSVMGRGPEQANTFAGSEVIYGFQTAISSQLSDRPTHLLTDRMTDRPTDLPTYPPTDRPNDRTTDGGVAMTEDRRCRWLCGTDRRTRRHSHLGLHVLALDIWRVIVRHHVFGMKR